MPVLTEPAQPRGLKLLQYGESGSGKTYRACRFAAYGPMYFFDFDGKMETMKLSFAKDHPDLAKNITYDFYSSIDPVKFATAVRTKLNELAKTSPYQTLVFDSWTAFEAPYMAYLMAKSSGFGGKGWGEQRQTITTEWGDKIIVPGTADHQIKNIEFPRFIRALTALPLNIIVNCHVKDPMTGPATVHASGEVAKTLPKYFHEWCYLYVTNNFYRVRVRASEAFGASSPRKDVPPNGILEKDDLDAYAPFLVKV